MQNKIILLAAGTLMYGTINAQNVVDAVRFGSLDITGTSRYRAMGGAFGALGGDVSSMTDNPAGMGIFRGTSEISFTPNLSFSKSITDGNSKTKRKKSDVSVSNFSYVMSFKTEDAEHLVNFNLGIGFNHSGSTVRRYETILDDPKSSFGFYLENMANNALCSLNQYDNPSYLKSNAGWNSAPLLALLGYDCYAIDDNIYKDQNGIEHCEGVISFDQANSLNAYQRMFVRESNRFDEYNLNASFNWDDFIYAGLTMSIVDFNSTINTEFNEDYDYEYKGNYTQYYNDIETKGSGVNFKLGVIVKPIDQWRIGLAVHTPSWLEMRDYYFGQMITDDKRCENYSRPTDGTLEYRYRYYTPWEYQFSTAYVFGTRAILSLEYDMKDYTDMKYKQDHDVYDYSSKDVLRNVNRSIKNNTALQHTIKAGLEYRVTPQLSLRAGYAHKTRPFAGDVYNSSISRGIKIGKDSYYDGNYDLFDSSTKPNYSLLDTQDFYSGGIGWRGKIFSFDLSCMSQIRKEKVAAFPTSDAFWWDSNGVQSEEGVVRSTHLDLKDRTLHWDLTIGMRF